MGMVIVASGVIFAGIFSAVVLMLAGGTVLVKKYCNGEDKTRHKGVKIVFTGARLSLLHSGVCFWYYLRAECF